MRYYHCLIKDRIGLRNVCTLKHSHYSPPDAIPGSKMANQDFHRILKTVLEIITDKGSVGFVMRKGRTAYRSRYVINVIRADIELPSLESTLTTGNPFLGFPGRHSSNQPCAQCKLRRRVYDPWIKILLTTRTVSRSSSPGPYGKQRTLSTSTTSRDSRFFPWNPQSPLT